ncbi:MAG TPA: hypothetical protein VJU86_02910 [Pyrinomonadaceae bacterium]|nr:hypothetical protein [Pyrinomonadaceae bacterium]
MKRLVLVLVLCVLAGWLLTRAALMPGRAQAPKERILEDMIPTHVPIKVKIKKEKEKVYKDLNNAKWARDFELELTNTGSKPIYFLYMLLVLPEIRHETAGLNIVFPLTYGRDEIGDATSMATPEDVPIKPGETYVFKIHPGQVPAWEKNQREQNRPQPIRIQLKLQILSFGDGTGYMGSGGDAVSRTVSKQSGAGGCLDHPIRDGPELLERLFKTANKSRLIAATYLPASFLPVNFLGRYSILRTIFEPVPQDCCPGDGCARRIAHSEPVCVNCPSQNRPTTTSCNDPAGACVREVYMSTWEWTDLPLPNN